MSFLVVPYNNAMMLGQGFNTYTQSLCLDRAVIFKTQDAKVQDKPDTTKIPQIVTYSSHFVEKLSDVVKALNVSAALSVKVGTVTGSGSGSYIDEDKIKQSDINFIITVKVTNQKTGMPGEAQFNSIEGLDRSKFADTYGDTFISGFLEGGEFVGIVSIKCNDTSKVQDIKAQLEIGFSAVQAKGAGGYVDSNLAKGTETSVTVNWSGGGQLKKPEDQWDIKKMMEVAAGFPDRCAICPQRTSAVVTKYTNLFSFLKMSAQFDPLSYDNAGVYTSDLLDDYMDYKIQWKNVRLMADSVKDYQKSEDPNGYAATTAGLDVARREILKQMVIIVNEVDAVRLDPKHAQDAILKGSAPYVNPAVFEARLPVKKPPAPPVPPPVITPVPPPVAPPAPPPKPDAKTWMWVKVPGKDSNGNDLSTRYEGQPIEDLMRKAYEWEAQNPGKYIKAINTVGYLKTKVLHGAELNNVNFDLYVRVLINDQWAFYPGVDSGGNDVPIPGLNPNQDADRNDGDIIDMMKILEPRQDVVAFNSIQWAKNRVLLPMPAFPPYKDRPFQGCWVRKSLFK
jgi:hypothetical protein